MSEIEISASNNRRIAKNTVFLYFRMIVVMLISIYTTRIVLNALGVVDYGIYNVVAGFVTMFAFLNTSMVNTTQRYYNYELGSGNIQSLRKVYNTAVRIQILIAVFTVLLLETIGIWYINNKMVIPVERLSATKWVFQSSVVSLVLLILQIPYSAAVISHEKMDFYAILSIIDALFKLGIAVLVTLVKSDKLITYGILIFLLSIFNFLCYSLYARKRFEEIRIEGSVDKTYLGKMLGFSGWNILEAISYILQGQGLNMLMNLFWGPIVNASRGLAYQIQGAVSGFSGNIATAFRPQLVESYASADYNRTQNLMFSMTKYGFLMLAIVSLPIIAEMPQILNIWLKGTVPDYTVSFTILVLVNLLINGFNMPLTQTVLATGKVKTYQIVRSFINASPLLIAWLFIRLGYGPTIVFIVTIAVSLVNQVVSMALLHCVFSFSYKKYLQKVVLPCLFFVLFAPVAPFVVCECMDVSILRLLVVIVISLIFSYFVALFLVLSKQEKRALMRGVKSKLKK